MTSTALGLVQSQYVYTQSRHKLIASCDVKKSAISHACISRVKVKEIRRNNVTISLDMKNKIFSSLKIIFVT